MYKKIIIIILLVFSNLYPSNDYVISDNSIRMLKNAGIEIDPERMHNIKLIAEKYSKIAKELLFDIKNIDTKLNKEYEKVDVNNLEVIKELIFEKKRKEADFDYIIMSCDLDILDLFSEKEIKKLKYYIIFQK